MKMGVLRCTFELHLFESATATDAALCVKEIIEHVFASSKSSNTAGTKGAIGNGVTNSEPLERNGALEPLDSQQITGENKQYRINVDTLPQCLVFDVAVPVPAGANSERLKLKFRRMLEQISKLQYVKEARNFPFAEHGIETLHKFFETSDGRMIEFELKSLVFSQQSKFQFVEIYDTVQFGRLLVLDKFQQLAESDLIYTTSIMRQGLISYANRQVLILGGGDGGILHEVLKEGPAHVVVVDIDETVVKAVRENMRTVCGDSLDTYNSARHTIIIGDAFEYLKHAAAEGKKFDIILSDLTDFPITDSVAGEQWDLLKHDIELSMPCLKSAAEDGHFLIHGVGRSALNTIQQFEELLNKFKQPPAVNQLRWEKHEAFVPSFLEYWQFYDIQRI